MGEPGQDTLHADTDAVVVEGADTTVVVEDKGADVAAAQAVIAEQAAETADQKAEAAAQVAVAAGEVAVDADVRAQGLESEFASFRAEFGEVRGFIGELYQDHVERKRAEQEAAQTAAQVEEVPVNDTAAREAKSDNDSQQSAGKEKADSKAGEPVEETRRPAQRGGLRHRRRG